MSTQSWLLIAGALAGGLGALTRWWLDLVFTKKPSGGGVPLGVLAANVIASLCAGAVLAVVNTVPEFGNPMVWFLLLSGYLGGLSTFSSVAVDSVILAQQRRWLWFAANTVGMLLLCVLVCNAAYWSVSWAIM